MNECVEEEIEERLKEAERRTRDEFARAALSGILVNCYDTTDEGLKKAADAAYRCADFMIKRRNRK